MDGQNGIYSGDATVLRQERYAPDCLKMTLRIPTRRRFDAGQFVHIRCGESTFPLLRRPFSVWDARPAARGGQDVDLLYTVVGAGTRVLAGHGPRSSVGLMGPLGVGFHADPDADVFLFVAGGVGVVPFYLFARQIRAGGLSAPMILLFGARTKSMLYGIDDFAGVDVEAHAATEDGSRGRRGLVTDLLADFLRRARGWNVRMHACGPEGMLERVARLAERRHVPCEVNLEKRMGCALGACGACVQKVWADDGKDWRYSRICHEGPTYDARKLIMKER